MDALTRELYESALAFKQEYVLPGPGTFTECYARFQAARQRFFRAVGDFQQSVEQVDEAPRLEL